MLCGRTQAGVVTLDVRVVQKFGPAFRNQAMAIKLHNLLFKEQQCSSIVPASTEYLLLFDVMLYIYIYELDGLNCLDGFDGLDGLDGLDGTCPQAVLNKNASTSLSMNGKE